MTNFDSLLVVISIVCAAFRADNDPGATHDLIQL